jgi:hypothetical protein
VSFGAWVLVPLALGVLALGLGLLVERLAGRRIDGALLLPLGVATVIVVAGLTTRVGTTAGFTTPLVVAMALLGFALGWRRLRSSRPDPWAAVAAFAVFAAVIAVLVGGIGTTFTGYTVLDDTAVHLLLLDHVGQEGHAVPEAVRSSTDAFTAGYLNTDYPLGAQLPVLVGSQLTGVDIAWAYVPTLAVLLAAMALALFSLAGRVAEQGWQRAAMAAIPAQTGLLYAYALQGSIKEVGVAYVVALVAALVSGVLDGTPSARGLLPIAVAVAASIGVLSLAALPWLGVPLAALAAVLLLRAGRERAPRVMVALLTAAGAAALLALPSLLGARNFVTVARAVLEQAADLGNLARPLETVQVFGIWPNGDYRLELMSNETAVKLLIAVAAFAAVLGLISLTLRARRSPGPLIYVVGSLVACAYLLRSGSPYADGKTLAVASAAVVFAALAGAAWLWGTRLRILGGLLTVAIAGGVLWTNALAYHDVALAPHDRFAELDRIGELVEGDGPTLFDEYEQFAPYFLRRAEPVGAPGAQLRYKNPEAQAALEGGKLPRDLDQLDWRWVREHPYVVVRRSPFASRPGSGYDLAWRGEYYELWKRDRSTRVLAHVAPPDGPTSRSVVPCSTLRRLSKRAAALPAGRFVYARRSVAGVVLPSEAIRKPRGWMVAPNDPTAMFVAGPGEVDWTVSVPRGGEWNAWLAGPFGRGFELLANGRRVGDVSYELGNPGQYLRLGTLRLRAGRHKLRLIRDGGDLRAGNGRGDAPLGPLVLERAGADTARSRIQEIPPSAYRRLCGKPVDWAEVVDKR